MIKPGSNYKMSRATKTMLARSWNNLNLPSIRRAVIDAELHSRIVVKTKRDKDN